MKKVIAWFKRPVNINLTVFMIIAVGLLIFALVSLLSTSRLTKLLDNLGNLISTAESREEIGDVEGYGIIFGSIVYGAVTLGNSVVRLITVYIPLAAAFFIGGQAVLARFIYAVSETRLICYRVITATCCISTVIALALYTAIGFIEPVSGIIMTAVDIIALAAIIICIRNTYTGRIKRS